jgi:hypothetical protein
VQLKPDVLIVQSLTAIHAAKQATKTIPIVMMTTQDPVAAGIKTSSLIKIDTSNPMMPAKMPSKTRSRIFQNRS